MGDFWGVSNPIFFYNKIILENFCLYFFKRSTRHSKKKTLTVTRKRISYRKVLFGKISEMKIFVIGSGTVLNEVIWPLFQRWNVSGTTTIAADSKKAGTKGRLTKMLCQTMSPEEKRKIIGDVFVKVANEVIADLNLRPEEVFVGQGTLRPDLIESASTLASTKADVIKTHHNDSELIRQLREAGRVVEPLKDFHKDEVRVLGQCIYFLDDNAYVVSGNWRIIWLAGRDLGLPVELVMRHPFPGPGLAIRVLCAEEPYIDRDFSETQVIVKIIVEYEQMLLKVN